MVSFFAGLSLGLSLIVAIGSQNAFVLKQGLKKQHVFYVCSVCAVSDAILIALGVSGFGATLELFPSIKTVARYGGAIFLVTYAFMSFRSALTNNHILSSDTAVEVSVGKSIATALAFTWLNPHVYLDTVILLGSISTQYQPQQWVFAGGAITGSFLFFFSLGYGARVLTPLFKKPRTWQVLEFLIGVIMVAIALSLVLGA